MNKLFNYPFFTAIALASLLFFTQCGGYGEDYMENEDEATATDTTATDSIAEGVAYPRDEVLEETNLEADGDYNLPMEMGEAASRIEKKQLLALLMRQKTDMMYRIEELEALPGDASDNTVVRGDIDKLRTYIAKLEAEIVDVRKAQVGSMPEVAESALAAVKGAGALMQSSVIRIDRGF